MNGFVKTVDVPVCPLMYDPKTSYLPASSHEEFFIVNPSNMSYDHFPGSFISIDG